MQNRRAGIRRKTYVGGRIVIRHQQTTMDCLLRDMGDGGARLAGADVARLPQRFELEIGQASRVYAARIAWRRPDAVGVVLSERRDVDGAPGDLAGRIRKLEREKAHLRNRLAELSTGF